VPKKLNRIVIIGMFKRCFLITSASYYKNIVLRRFFIIIVVFLIVNISNISVNIISLGGNKPPVLIHHTTDHSTASKEQAADEVTGVFSFLYILLTYFLFRLFCLFIFIGGLNSSLVFDRIMD
jgi:hypothetical protein